MLRLGEALLPNYMALGVAHPIPVPRLILFLPVVLLVVEQGVISTVQGDSRFIMSGNIFSLYVSADTEVDILMVFLAGAFMEKGFLLFSGLLSG